MEDILPVADIVRRLREINPNGVPKSRWHEDNKKRVYANIKQWKQDNPDKARSQRQPKDIARRARLRGSIGSFTLQEWNNLIEVHGHRCAYCKKITKRLTVDHIIPLSIGGEGGTNFIDNILPACSKCNSSKRANQWDAQLVLQDTPSMSVS